MRCLCRRRVGFDEAGDTLDIYVVACGGDGTVVWVTEELVAHGVDIESVVVCFLPFGTGNDFSVATGFGSNYLLTPATLPPLLESNPYLGLKSVISDFLNGEVKKVDIWDVEIICNEVSSYNVEWMHQEDCIGREREETKRSTHHFEEKYWRRSQVEGIQEKTLELLFDWN